MSRFSQSFPKFLPPVLAVLLLLGPAAHVAWAQGVGGWGESDKPAETRDEPATGDDADQPKVEPGKTDAPKAPNVPQAPDSADPRKTDDGPGDAGPADESGEGAKADEDTPANPPAEAEEEPEPIWVPRSAMASPDDLLKQLQSANAEERANAAGQLGLLQVREAAGPLTEALRDREWTVREQAAFALGCLGQADALTQLHGMASRETVPNARRAAVWAAGRIGEARSVPMLQKLLSQDQPDHVREAILIALSRLGGRSAVRTILDTAASEPNDRIRKKAMRLAGVAADSASQRALAARRFDQITSDRLRPRERRQIAIRCSDEVRWLGEAGRRTALVACKHHDANVRWAGIRALQYLGQPEDAAQLIRHLASKQEDIWVQHEAAVALGHIGGKTALATLQRGLEAESVYLRNGIIQGLAVLSDESTDQTLADLLRNQRTSTSVRIPIAESLGRIATLPAKQALLDTLFNKENPPPLREAAARGMGLTGAEGMKMHLETIRKIAAEGEWPRMLRDAGGAIHRLRFGHVIDFYEMPVFSAYPGQLTPALLDDSPSRTLCRWSEHRWTDLLDGDTIEFGFLVTRTDTYDLALSLTNSPQSPVIRVRLDGELIGGELDLYSEQRQATGPISFGEHKLSAGWHRLGVEVVRLNPEAVGVMRPVGLDCLGLTPVSAK